jgi:ribonuclease VapC
LIAVDTSALIAILLREYDASAFEEAIFQNQRIFIGAPTAFEFTMVAYIRTRAEPESDADAARLLALPGLEIVSWTQGHVALADAAFRRFGKGQGHPAQLNYGDCMSYALARALDVPLLFKGGDFALTDVVPAL